MAGIKGKPASNRIEMVGNTYNEWTVLEESHKKGKIVYYKCRCSCGEEYVVDGRNIRQGGSKRCTKCALNLTHKKNTGVPLTEERKRNISEAHKGKKLTEEHIAKLSVPRDDLCDQELLAIDPTRMEKENGLRISYKINQMKQKATSRGITWELNKIDVAKLITQPCHYSGHSPNPYNGLDRVDSSKGYSIDNVVPCCHACNCAKNSMSTEQFIEWANQLLDHQKTLKNL